MAICPNCASNIQAKKILVLTNHNAITCSTCRSKLRVENKVTNSAIGGVTGGVGGGLGILLLIQLTQTGNLVFLGLFVASFVGLLVVAWVWAVKAIKLKIDQSGYDKSIIGKAEYSQENSRLNTHKPN